jgi:hypothetical protein
MSLRGEVEHSQPAMAQSNSGISIDPRSSIIRTSVAKRAGHPQSGRAQLVSLEPAGRNEKSR